MDGPLCRVTQCSRSWTLPRLPCWRLVGREAHGEGELQWVCPEHCKVSDTTSCPRALLRPEQVLLASESPKPDTAPDTLRADCLPPLVPKASPLALELDPLPLLPFGLLQMARGWLYPGLQNMVSLALLEKSLKNMILFLG